MKEKRNRKKDVIPIIQPIIDDTQLMAKQAHEQFSQLKKQIDSALAPIQKFGQHIRTMKENEQNIVLSLLPNRQINSIPDWQVDQIADKISARKNKNKKNIDTIELVLTEEGDLKLKSKPELCYKLRSKKRLPLFRALIRNKSYTPTKLLIVDSGCASQGAFYKMVSALNQSTKKSLKLKTELIESRIGTGFRINRQYKITTSRS